MTCRVLMECMWSPDGHSQFFFAPGTVLSDGDPRLANGFLHVARMNGWVEVIAETLPSPATPIASPAEAVLSPGVVETGPTVRKATTRRKTTRKKAPAKRKREATVP